MLRPFTFAIVCMSMVWGGLFSANAVSPCPCENAHGRIQFHETFDTPGFLNRDLYDTRQAEIRWSRGELGLDYLSSQKSPPSGIECVIPPSAETRTARILDFRFLGGGTEMSNSLFIAYALEPGRGLSLPVLPAGSGPNNRTGYIVRFIRHGDGTNEIKFYRNDAGWVKELKRDWTLTFNPITTLRRAIIHHKRTGEHVVTATFDTGLPFDRIFTFEDDRYPPDDMHRGFQISAKGHAGVGAGAGLRMRTDTWAVYVVTSETGLGTNGESAARKNVGRPESFDGVEKFVRARQLFDEGDAVAARDICRRILARSPADADALDLLGQIEVANMDLPPAKVHLTQALDIRRRKNGPVSARTAESLLHVGHVLELQKNMAEAERLFKESLTIRETVFGVSHVEVAEALEHLAHVYVATDRFADLEPVYRRILQIKTQAWGPYHPDVVTAAQWVGELEKSRGRYVEAERLLHQALTGAEKNLGADHPMVANISDKLAIVYNIQRRYADALPLHLRALAIKQRVLGPDHPEVASNLTNLALHYYITRRYAEAEPLHLQALSIREKALGVDHPEVADSLNNLGLLRTAQGRYAEAERLYQRVLAIREKAFGPSGASVGDILENLSNLYKQTGRMLESEYHAARAKAIREKDLVEKLRTAPRKKNP